MQKVAAASRIADDEDRAVDGPFAVAREKYVVEAQGRRRDGLAYLQRKERADRPEAHPECLAEHPVDVQVVVHRFPKLPRPKPS